MIHPDTELREIDGAIGSGVFATRPIPMGTVVWTLDAFDLLISPERRSELGAAYAPILRHFGFRNRAGEFVVCWDLGRWLNHSCDPNVLSTGWDFDVAVRDIQAGEEITNDYSTLNLEYELACRCRTPRCRNEIRPTEFERLVLGIDAKVRRAIRCADRVPQPLEAWLEDPALLRSAARDTRLVPSVRSHMFREPVRETAGPRSPRSCEMPGALGPSPRPSL